PVPSRDTTPPTTSLPRMPEASSKRAPRRAVATAGLLALAATVCLLAVYASASYRYRMARDAAEALDFDRAQVHLDWCLRIWPWDREARLFAVQVARRRGDSDQAERLLEISEQQGVNAATAFERAMLLAQQGELAEVEQALRDRARQEGASA